jgi:hypothetical protein
MAQDLGTIQIANDVSRLFTCDHFLPGNGGSSLAPPGINSAAKKNGLGMLVVFEL